MQLFDISLPVRSGMVVYAGDAEVRLERSHTIAGGDSYNLSRLELGVHAGTHIDAPLHFIEGAAGVERVPLGPLIGPAHVVDATAISADIDVATLQRLAIPSGVRRLLFKTPNSQLWEREEFSPNFLGIREDAARALVSSGVRLVGVDYLSVAPMADPAPTHRVLLEAGVVILEGLDLRAVDPGPYQLVCLPLLIEGSDGAPARALLLR
jgi:arylformamidase